MKLNIRTLIIKNKQMQKIRNKGNKKKEKSHRLTSMLMMKMINKLSRVLNNKIRINNSRKRKYFKLETKKKMPIKLNKKKNMSTKKRMMKIKNYKKLLL
jgi:hypothetical protein